MRKLTTQQECIMASFLWRLINRGVSAVWALLAILIDTHTLEELKNTSHSLACQRFDLE